MKYKALLTDVDGTLVAYQHKDISLPKDPSGNVIQAVKKAAEKLTVCLATGRSYTSLQSIFTLLQLEGIAILNDGALVIDISKKSILHEALISQKDYSEVVAVIKTFSIPFWLTDNDKDFLYVPGYKPKRLMNIYADEVFSEKKVDEFIDKLSHIPTLNVQKTQHGPGRKFGFLISHERATKQIGALVVAKHLGIEPHEIIGIGDGYNDFPLLMACGLKVAMGNAVEDLKAIADYVAPPVTEDGVADVIEKFILNTH